MEAVGRHIRNFCLRRNRFVDKIYLDGSSPLALTVIVADGVFDHRNVDAVGRP